MKKSRVLLNSLLIIALCISLIAGATFALFTSESKTNIAVTSGEVKIVATAEIDGAWSAKWNGTGYDRNTDLEEIDNGYEFTNKGTVVYKNGTLTVANITPGDGVRLNIDILNYSNVKTRYRVEVKTVIEEDEVVYDEELLEQLSISYAWEGEADGIALNGTNPRYSDWMDLDKVDDAEEVEEVGTLQVELELPVTAGNEYQGMACKFVVSVFAVQWNGHIDDPVEDPVEDETPDNTVKTAIGDLATEESWENAERKSTIELNDNVTLSTDDEDGNGVYSAADGSWNLANEATLTISVDDDHELDYFIIDYNGDAKLYVEKGTVSPYVRLALGDSYDEVTPGEKYVVNGNLKELTLIVSGETEEVVKVTDVEVAYREVETPVEPEPHVHVWAEGWVSDEKGNHYQKCVDFDTCEGTSDPVACTYGDSYEKVDGEQHKQVCDDCGYEVKSSHTWSETGTSNGESGHTLTCTANGCGATKDEAHNEEGEEGGCNKCDYKPEVEEPEHEHKWVAEWSWTDYESAKVTVTCSNGCEETYTAEATITSTKDTATCDDAGEIVHTAKATVAELDNKEFEDTNTETTEALGHKYTGEYVDNEDGTHSRKCERYETCKTTGNKTECDLGDSYEKVDGEQHKQVCADCGYEVTSSHTWGSPDNDGESGHTLTCTAKDCGATKTEAHKLAYKDTENEETHDVYCSADCGYETTEAHDTDGDDDACSKCGYKSEDEDDGDEEGETLTATLEYKGETTTNMTGGNDAATLGADEDIFTVSSEKTNSGSDHVGLNKDGSIRLYYNHRVELHIDINEAFVIKSIEVTLVSGSPSKLEYLAVEVDGEKVSGDGVYAINSTSVVLYNSNTTNNQIQIASIEITYKQVGEYEPATKYTVTYAKGNEAAEGDLPETNSYKAGESFNLPECDLTLEGYTFDGWNDGKETYPAQYKYTMPAEDVTFTAQWKEVSTTEPSETAYYVKVTSTDKLVSGAKYLIVYDSGSTVYVFNGSLTTLDAVNDYVQDNTITISDNKIEATDALANAYFTFTASESGYTIKSASDKYINHTANSNGLTQNDTTGAVNTISFEDDNVQIINSGGARLRFNATNGQMRFRYYTATTYGNQKAIQLYMLVED